MADNYTNEFLNYAGLKIYDEEIKEYINEKAPQSNWAQIDSTKTDFIKNKPELGTLAAKDEVAKADLAADVQASLDKADSALQSYTETDPTVPAWAKSSSKPTYTASEVGAVPTSRTVNGKALSENITLSASDIGALPSTTDIPDALSDLTDDSTHRTVTDAEKATWNAKSNFNGDYNSLTNKPTLGSLAAKDQVVKADLSSDLQTAIDRVDFANGGTMGGSLVINGDLTVNGISTTVETFNENINVEDNTITLRYNATTGLQNSDYTGIVAQKYDGANNGMLVFDNNGTAYVGDEGDVQPLATRKLAAEDNGELVSWDAAKQTLVKAPVKVENIVTKDNFDSLNTVLSTNTNNAEMSYVKDVPTDSANYAVVTKLGGMTYKSKNLIDMADTTITASGYVFKNLSLSKRIQSGTYTLSFRAKNYTSAYKFQCAFFNSAGTMIANSGGVNLSETCTFTFTLDDEAVFVELYVNSPNGGTCYEFMLNAGSTALPYEPYYEGLRSAKVTEVKSVGVNLIPFPYVESSKTKSGVTFTVNNDGSILVSGTATEDIGFRLFSGNLASGVYYINGNISNAVVRLYDHFVPTWYSNQSFEFRNTQSTVIDIDIKAGASVSGVIYPILKKGSTALPYTPYVEHILPIPEAVQALDGYGLGVNESVYNYIDYEKKQFVKRVDKAVFDGTEWWNCTTGDPNPCFTTVLQTTLNGTPALCSHFKHINFPYVLPTGTTGVFGWDSSYVNLYFASGHTTIEEWKAYLAEQYANGTPVTVLYELAEPIVTDISDLIGDNSIGVQSNGTLTFESEHKYAVPSEVVFYNEKAEIVAADKIVGNLIGVSTRAISDEDGNSIANTYMKKSNALEVISGLTENQLQKLISFINTIELQ